MATKSRIAARRSGCWPRLLSAAEGGDYTGVGQTVFLREFGHLRRVEIGTKKLFDRYDIDAEIDRQKDEAEDSPSPWMGMKL